MIFLVTNHLNIKPSNFLLIETKLHQFSKFLLIVNNTKVAIFKLETHVYTPGRYYHI
jgi:hypothetical protein